MISLVVVNYRSAALSAEAIRSARATTSMPLHVIVVDNSGDASEADQLRAHADFLLVPERNLGYAGAINAARPHCRGGSVVVTNPDVVFFDGAIDRLVEALEHPDTAAAGPALYWDDARRWILPPGDMHTLFGRLGEALASRISFWRDHRSRRRLRRRLAFWALAEPVAVKAISGAVMALRLRDFDDAGGFDERFALYFEETDYLRRLTRGGRRVMYVPAAQCRHVYNQSAGAEATRAASLFAASEEAYFAKWYGRAVYRAIRRLEGMAPRPLPLRCSDPLELPLGRFVVEASPLASFDPAAGHFPAGRTVSLPPEVVRAYRGDVLYLRAVDLASGRVLFSCVR